MFPHKKLFCNIPCPDNESGDCWRPYCHFFHKFKIPPANVPVQAPSSSKWLASPPSALSVPIFQYSTSPTKEVGYVTKEDPIKPSKEVESSSSDEEMEGNDKLFIDEANLSTLDSEDIDDKSDRPSRSNSENLETLATNEINTNVGEDTPSGEPKPIVNETVKEFPESLASTDLFKGLVNEAVKKYLAENPLLSKIDASLVMGNLDTNAIMKSVTCQSVKKPVYPDYRPTPIKELNRMKSEEKKKRQAIKDAEGNLTDFSDSENENPSGELNLNNGESKINEETRVNSEVDNSAVKKSIESDSEAKVPTGKEETRKHIMVQPAPQISRKSWNPGLVKKSKPIIARDDLEALLEKLDGGFATTDDKNSRKTAVEVTETKKADLSKELLSLSSIVSDKNTDVISTSTNNHKVPDNSHILSEAPEKKTDEGKGDENKDEEENMDKEDEQAEQSAIDKEENMEVEEETSESQVSEKKDCADGEDFHSDTSSTVNRKRMRSSSESSYREHKRRRRHKESKSKRKKRKSKRRRNYSHSSFSEEDSVSQDFDEKEVKSEVEDEEDIVKDVKEEDQSDLEEEGSEGSAYRSKRSKRSKDKKHKKKKSKHKSRKKYKKRKHRHSSSSSDYSSSDDYRERRRQRRKIDLSIVKQEDLEVIDLTAVKDESESDEDTKPVIKNSEKTYVKPTDRTHSEEADTKDEVKESQIKDSNMLNDQSDADDSKKKARSSSIESHDGTQDFSNCQSDSATAVFSTKTETLTEIAIFDKSSTSIQTIQKESLVEKLSCNLTSAVEDKNTIHKSSHSEIKKSSSSSHSRSSSSSTSSKHSKSSSGSKPDDRKSHTKSSNSDHPSKSRSSSKTNISSDKKSSSSDKKDSSTVLKGSSINKKDSSSDKKDISSIKRDSSSNKKDSTSDKKDSSTIKKDSSNDKKSSSSDKKSSSSDKKSSSSDKRRTSSDKKDSFSIKKESSSDRKSGSSLKRSSSSQKSSDHKKSSSTGKKSSSNDIASSSNRKSSSDKKISSNKSSSSGSSSKTHSSDKESRDHNKNKTTSKDSFASSDYGNDFDDVFGNIGDQADNIGDDADEDMPSDSSLPDLSALDSITAEDWENMIYNDAENDSVTEDECMKMYQDFQKPPSPPPTTDQKKTKKNVLEETSAGIKRIARPGAVGNLLGRVHTRPLGKRKTPGQVMMERYEKLKQQQAELEQKMNLCQTKPSSSEVIRSSKASTPDVPLYPLGKKTNRISSVGNVTALLKETEAMKARTSSAAAKAAATGTVIAAGGGLGSQRVAHVPKMDLTSRPIISAEFGGKVPQMVRQRYLNSFIEAAVKITSVQTEAFQIALSEEKICYKRASSRNVYLQLACNTTKRLRGGTVSDAAKEMIEADGITLTEKTPATSKPGPSVTPAPMRRVQSHFATMSSGGNRGSWSIEKPAKKSIESQFEKLKGPKLYEFIQRYVMSMEDQEKNVYPRPHPEIKGKAVVMGISRKKVNPSPSERYCSRCGVVFIVDKWGYPKNTSKCVYHWGRSGKRRGPCGFESRYNCCQGDGSSEGCCLASCHVSDNYDPENLTGFVRTMPKDNNSSSNYGVFALDCEMSYTSQGSELTRITVVNHENKIIYEKFVQPSNPVIDYNTRFSGITEEDLEDVTTTLTDVQAALLTKFSSKTILIGHSLESDLMALKMIHDTVIDTSLLFPHKMGLPYKRALRNLASEHLKKLIQNDVGGHDSAEDAITCMELLYWKVKEDLKTIT